MGVAERVEVGVWMLAGRFEAQEEANSWCRCSRVMVTWKKYEIVGAQIRTRSKVLPRSKVIPVASAGAHE